MTINVIEERRNDLPGGLPAIWEQGESGVTLYLRDDLPPGLADHFRQMCTESLGHAVTALQATG